MLLMFEFPQDDVTIRAALQPDRAPATCEALVRRLQGPVEIVTRHAIWTGPEMSMQLPAEPNDELLTVPGEALTTMPQPGQVLFTAVPAFAWPGATAPILDIGLYYGPHARTLFPLGWLAGNAFAVVVDEDLALAAAKGASLLKEGERLVRLRLEQ